MKKIIFLVSLFTTSFVFAADEVPPPQPVEMGSQPTRPAAAPAPAGQPTPLLQPAGSVVAPAAEPTAPVAQVHNEQTIPTPYRVNAPAINTKVGAGVSFDPTAFWLAVDAEIQFDKFIAIGPKLQWGENSTTDFIFGSFGPRFIIPFNYFEFGVQGGLGFAYRNVAGFEVTNFLYQTGMNFDLYLTKNISLGLGYSANFTSAPAQKFVSALTFSVAGHF